MGTREVRTGDANLEIIRTEMRFEAMRLGKVIVGVKPA